MVEAAPVISGLLEPPERRDDIILELLSRHPAYEVIVETAHDLHRAFVRDILHCLAELLLRYLPVTYTIIVE